MLATRNIWARIIYRLNALTTCEESNAICGMLNKDEPEFLMLVYNTQRTVQHVNSL